MNTLLLCVLKTLVVVYVRLHALVHNESNHFLVTFTNAGYR